MATLSSFSALPSASISTSRNNLFLVSSRSLPLPRFLVRGYSRSFGRSTLKAGRSCKLRQVRAAEEESLIPELQKDEASGVEDALSSSEQPSATVPVSPSDPLTMFFLAEGTMIESAIPTVTKALEGLEDITNLKVQVVEGIASVELTKQTTVQATGVASGLIETIQGSGFKLQTLNLSFEDKEDIFV